MGFEPRAYDQLVSVTISPIRKTPSHGAGAFYAPVGLISPFASVLPAAGLGRDSRRRVDEPPQVRFEEAGDLGAEAPRVEYDYADGDEQGAGKAQEASRARHRATRRFQRVQHRGGRARRRSRIRLIPDSPQNRFQMYTKTVEKCKVDKYTIFSLYRSVSLSTPKIRFNLKAVLAFC